MMPTLLCLSRCKYVPDTPEERVRQQMLRKLRDELGWPIPSDYVAVELHLSYAADTNDRADIVLYKPDGDNVVPWMVIEVKEPNQPLDAGVREQAWRYCKRLGVPRYALYNGTEEPHVFEVPSMDNPNAYCELERISRFDEVLIGTDVPRVSAEDYGDEWNRRTRDELDDPRQLAKLIDGSWSNHLGAACPQWLAREVIDLYGLLLCDPVTTPSTLPWSGYSVTITAAHPEEDRTFRDAGGERVTIFLRPFSFQAASVTQGIVSFGVYPEYECTNDSRYGTRSAKTVLLVSMDRGDGEKARDLQLHLEKYAHHSAGRLFLTHNGAISGRRSHDLRNLIAAKCPDLLNAEGKICLGSMPAGGYLEWQDVRDTLLRLTSYTLLRKEFKERGLL